MICFKTINGVVYIDKNDIASVSVNSPDDDKTPEV